MKILMAIVKTLLAMMLIAFIAVVASVIIGIFIPEQVQNAYEMFFRFITSLIGQ